MASDQEIAEGLLSLFRESNPNSFTSLNDIILRLQSKLGFDLSHKIDFIRAQITILFAPPPPPPPPTHILNPNPNLLHQHHHHVYQHPPAHSHFPPTFATGVHHRGPTEISFGQPCATALVDSQSSAPAKDSAQSRPKRRGGLGGLSKLYGVSPLLQTIVGQPTMARPEIVKQLWAYIRKHNLQDPSNKRKIICNDELRLVFEADSTDFFQMNKLLGKHILSLDPKKDSGQQFKRVKVEESEVQSRPKRKGGLGGLNKLCGVSPLLQTIVGQPTMARTEIVEQLWAYIRKHNLQDPSNKRKIICNDELRLVFETDSTDMFQMNKLLGKHILSLYPKKDSGQQFKRVKVEESEVPRVKVEESEVPRTEPAPIVISEALVKFFGTSEKEMLQVEVYKRIEECIKMEGLEDRLNSMVICDTKLQELFRTS